MSDSECYRCYGEGFILICPDDMCHGLGECIHGDGEVVCPACNGEGTLWYEDDDGEVTGDD